MVKINKILVSQPRPTSEKSPYFEMAAKYGVEIVFRPFIKVEGFSAKDFRQQKVSILEHSAIIFTAKTAIDHFFRLCEEMRISIPDTMKYFCTSDSIANYLQKYIIFRKRKIFSAQTGKFVDLLPYILKHKKEKYLLTVSDVNNGTEAAMLSDNNINYTRAAMYSTVSNDFTEGEVFDYDMLVFFSPQGIESLLKNFPDFEQGNIRIATFGEATAQAVRDAHLRLDVSAPSPEAPSMASALNMYLSETNPIECD